MIDSLASPLVRLTSQGLYCPSGGFYIDPMQKVERALITHAHSDHARRGSQNYLCADPGLGLLRMRLGEKAVIQSIPYRHSLRIGSVKVSFHPAGHILGSAQIRIEAQNGEVWVVSGDYKREPDPTCEAFEVVRCDTFISEATFGHPSFRWENTAEEFEAIYHWWKTNQKNGRNSILNCYALGKTQRVLGELGRFSPEPIYLFGEAVKLTDCYRKEGVVLPPTKNLEELTASEGSALKGALILSSSSITSSSWIARLGYPDTAFASGWMIADSPWRGGRRSYQQGFVISDHADWPGLIETIRQTGAQDVLIQHTEDEILPRYLRKMGLRASLMNEKSIEKAHSSQGQGIRPSSSKSKANQEDDIPIQGELF